MARHGENNFVSFDDSQLQEILRPTLARRSYSPVPDDELTADSSGIFMEEAVETAWDMEAKVKKGYCSGPKRNKKHEAKLTDADREFHPPSALKSALKTITSELREADANEPLRVPLKPSSKGKSPMYISLTPSSKGKSKGESKGESKGKSYNDKSKGKSKGNFPPWQVPAWHGAWQSPSWHWQASAWQSPFSGDGQAYQASAWYHPLQTRLSAYFFKIFALGNPSTGNIPKNLSNAQPRQSTADAGTELPR